MGRADVRHWTKSALALFSGVGVESAPPDVLACTGESTFFEFSLLDELVVSTMVKRGHFGASEQATCPRCAVLVDEAIEKYSL